LAILLLNHFVSATERAPTRTARREASSAVETVRSHAFDVLTGAADLKPQIAPAQKRLEPMSKRISPIQGPDRHGRLSKADLP